MSLSRRSERQPLKHPSYNFRDVPWCSKDLSGSTLSEVTDRQDCVDCIAEMLLLSNEATRRKNLQKKAASSNGSSSDRPPAKEGQTRNKPLGVEYIFDRIDTDDPLWGFIIRTDTPDSLKEQRNSVKSQPQCWRRGMLQGFITVTTFTCWKSSLRFDSLHESAFAYDDDELRELRRTGFRKYDEDGTLAEEMEASVRGGDPWNEGIVFPRIAEVSLCGGLGCGKQLLNLVIERLERAEPSATQNFDFIVLQATKNSISFYESMGFVRVGCVQDMEPSSHGYRSSPVESYVTMINGETPQTIANYLGVDVWDIVFLNARRSPLITPGSWLKKCTPVLVPSQNIKIRATSDAIRNQILGGSLSDTTLAPRWYIARENDTPRVIANRFNVDFEELLQANKKRYPDLVGHSKLRSDTRIQISGFDSGENDYAPYFHWTFPDDNDALEEPSYMMALKLKKKTCAASNPMSDSLKVPIHKYSPDLTGATDLLIDPMPAPISNGSSKRVPHTHEPKKPEKPSSAYALFCNNARISMKEELRGKSGAESVQFYLEKWNSLTEEEKRPFRDNSTKAMSAYAKALAKYERDLARNQIGTVEAVEREPGVGTSLLEKVVKLKKSSCAFGHTEKFEYFYVLTVFPDLQWVHLLPMVRAGVFGPEHPEASGRPIWMVVSEEELEELDTSAFFCIPVASRAMMNSAYADDEQWDIQETSNESPLPFGTMGVSVECCTSGCDSIKSKTNSSPCQQNDIKYTEEDVIHCPGPHDYLFGNEKSVRNHTGNSTLKNLVMDHLGCSDINIDKVVDVIVSKWRNLDPPGRFLEIAEMPIIVGDKIEARKVDNCYREGTIRTCYENGTYDICYADGSEEHLQRKFIRALGPKVWNDVENSRATKKLRSSLNDTLRSVKRARRKRIQPKRAATTLEKGEMWHSDEWGTHVNAPKRLSPLEKIGQRIAPMLVEEEGWEQKYLKENGVHNYVFFEPCGKEKIIGYTKLAVWSFHSGFFESRIVDSVREQDFLESLGILNDPYSVFDNFSVDDRKNSHITSSSQKVSNNSNHFTPNESVATFSGKESAGSTGNHDVEKIEKHPKEDCSCFEAEACADMEKPKSKKEYPFQAEKRIEIKKRKSSPLKYVGNQSCESLSGCNEHDEVRVNGPPHQGLVKDDDDTVNFFNEDEESQSKRPKSWSTLLDEDIEGDHRIHKMNNQQIDTERNEIDEVRKHQCTELKNQRKNTLDPRNDNGTAERTAMIATSKVGCDCNSGPPHTIGSCHACNYTTALRSSGESRTSDPVLQPFDDGSSRLMEMFEEVEMQLDNAKRANDSVGEELYDYMLQWFDKKDDFRLSLQQCDTVREIVRKFDHYKGKLADAAAKNDERSVSFYKKSLNHILNRCKLALPMF